MTKQKPGNVETPRYERPQVLAIDLPGDLTERLTEAGYNVGKGTFGSPYPVPMTVQACPMPSNSASLPDLEESDIVVARIGSLEPRAQATPEIGVGVEWVWQLAETGVIDVRPFEMRDAKTKFQKVLANGGIALFIVSEEYKIAYRHGSQYEANHGHGERVLTNWDLIPVRSQMQLSRGDGKHVDFAGGPLAATLAKAAESARYSVTFKTSADAGFDVLATNKHKEAVAITYGLKGGGRVILLPEMPALGSVIVELFQLHFAQLCPKLFPHQSAESWIHRDPYETESVADVQRELATAHAEAKEGELQAKLDEARADSESWYDLLSGTGTPLVKAVIWAVGELGFKKVEDMDVLAEKGDGAGDLREDLQILDGLPTLIVDIKGVSGMSSDQDVLQAHKHATMRMRELKRFDVQALSIINHQRGLPPLDRGREAFRQEIVDNAVDLQQGLLTAWDLACLVRNKRNLKWSDGQTMPVLYRTGRITPTPDHYVLLGQVVKLWSKDQTVGVIPAVPLDVGDTIAYSNGGLFVEEQVTSLNVDEQSVETASTQSNCGIQTDGKLQVRKRDTLYVIRDGGAS